MNRSRESHNLPLISKSGSNLIPHEHGLVEVVVEDNLIPTPCTADDDNLGATDGQCNTTTAEGQADQEGGRACGDEMVKLMVKSAIKTGLYHAALNGDWKMAQSILNQNRELKVTDSITRDKENILHIAAASKHSAFVKKLIDKMTPDDMTLPNKHGNTALCFAATSGTVRIAMLIVEKNKDLPLIRGYENGTPLFIAISYRHEKMAYYLLSVTDLNQLTSEDQIQLLIATIHSDFYGIGLTILKGNPKLATMKNTKYNNETALHVLARKPSAISSRHEINTLKKCITFGTCNKDVVNTLARQLVSLLWERVLKDLTEKEMLEFVKHPTILLHDAARAGNVEFLIMLISTYPDIIWEEDDDGKSIFHIAVENRLENIFILIHEISGPRDFSTRYKTTIKGKYNMLHLAAKLPALNHLNRVSGAALQMQRELLWFKEVEKIVLPCQLEAKCDDDSVKLTPRELFTKEHKDLRKYGEEWMKNTANSCMLVATLIATVVFAAAFTVPGGSADDTGNPIFQRKHWFSVFVISDAVALVSSSTSILIFLSILTSRYAEDDFLLSLPSKLLFGLVLLFISIVCMVVAFSATFFLLYHERANIWVPATVAAMAIIPVSCFCSLQFKLWVDTFHNTYLSKFVFKPRRRKLFSSFTSEVVDYYRRMKKKM